MVDEEIVVDKLRHINEYTNDLKEIEALENADVISSNTQEKMEEAVGFRNILAHRYGDVNHDVVYDVLHNDLHWFEQFQQEVAQWFQEYQQYKG